MITIGVTGHRDLEPDPTLRESVRRASAALLHRLAPAGAAATSLVVLSPLAEGADRIVAQVMLEEAQVQLDVILPLPAAAYEADFATESSRREFAELLRHARRVQVMPRSRSRTEAYLRVGRYVVDQSDGLIALWDGMPAEGPGGTADVVRYAQARRRPILWIRPSNPPQLAADWTGRGFAPLPETLT